MITFLLRPLLWAFLFYRRGTEAQRIQIKTSKASSLLAPIEVQSNQASKRGSNPVGFHLGGFALGGQFQLIRARKTGPHILSGCLNTGILPPLPDEQTWVWAKPACEGFGLSPPELSRQSALMGLCEDLPGHPGCWIAEGGCCFPSNQSWAPKSSLSKGPEEALKHCWSHRCTANEDVYTQAGGIMRNVCQRDYWVSLLD